jgi:hypothetical protein
VTRAIYLLAVACAAALAAGCDRGGTSQARGPRVELKLQWTAGTYALSVATTASQQIVSGARRDAVSYWQLLDATAAVRSARGGHALDIRYDRVRQTMLGAGPSMTFDSNLPDDAPTQSPTLAPVLRPLVGTTLSLAYDGEGRLQKVTGVSALAQRLEDSQPAALDDASEWRSQVSDQALRDAIDVQWLLPDRMVGPGEPWKASRKGHLPLLGDVSVQYECALLEVDRAGNEPVAVIGVQATIAAENTTSGGKTFRAAKGKFSQSGQVRLGLDSRMVHSQKLAQKGAIEATAADGQPVRLTLLAWQEIQWTLR